MERLIDTSSTRFVESKKLQLRGHDSWYETEFLHACKFDELAEIDCLLLYIDSLIKQPQTAVYRGKVPRNSNWNIYYYNWKKKKRIQFGDIQELSHLIIKILQETKKTKRNTYLEINFYENKVFWPFVFSTCIKDWNIETDNLKDEALFIYDTNFRIFREQNADVKWKIDGLSHWSFIFKRASNCLLDYEVSDESCLPKKEFSQLIAKFKRELWEINPELKEHILKLFWLFYNSFFDLYNIIYKIKKENPRKNFDEIKDKLFESINKECYLDKEFLKKYNFFFQKIFKNIDTRNNKKELPTLIDWFNFCFAIIKNIFSERNTKIVFVSDDSDIKVIADIFMQHILPEYITQIFNDLLRDYYQVTQKKNNNFVEFVWFLEKLSDLECNKEWRTLMITSDVSIRVKKLVRDFLENTWSNRWFSYKEKKQIVCLFAPSRNTITKYYLPDVIINWLRWDEASFSRLSLQIVELLTQLKLIQTLNKS